jgi:polar amino acid transport system substrate-binding protein
MARRIICIIWLLLACPLLVQAESIVVFGAQDYPGVCYLKDGKPQGIFPEILAGVAKYSGDDYKLRLLPWARAQAMAQGGKGGIAHFSMNNERLAVFDFSDPVYVDDIILVAIKGKQFLYAQPGDLKGRRLGVMASASYGQQVDSMMHAGDVTVDLDYGVVSRLRKLLAGRIDVAVVEGTEGNIDDVLAADGELKMNAAKFVILPVPLVHDPLYLAFAKSMNRQDALERFNAGLARFKKTPSYKALVRK